MLYYYRFSIYILLKVSRISSRLYYNEKRLRPVRIRAKIMKRIAVLLLSIMFAVVTYGQNNEDQSKDVYAFVTVVKSTDKTTATIDFGDGTPKMAFADEKGKKRKFETPFEPINTLIKEGWEIDQFSYTISGVNTISAYIMKKTVIEEFEVKEGMLLVEE